MADSPARNMRSACKTKDQGQIEGNKLHNCPRSKSVVATLTTEKLDTNCNIQTINDNSLITSPLNNINNDTRGRHVSRETIEQGIDINIRNCMKIRLYFIIWKNFFMPL